MNTYLDTARYGVVFVWTAVIIFAAGNSVVRLLFEIGAQNPVGGRNAISFCNVLFVGNLCAMCVLATVYFRDCSLKKLSSLSAKHWLSIFILGFLSGALAPGLMFLALDNTEVSNVVLFSRVEPPLFMLFAFLFLGEKSSRWDIVAAVIIVCGIATIIILQNEDGNLISSIGKGELQTLAAATTLAVSSIISRHVLQDIPFGIFAVFRTGLGAVIFFGVAVYLFGFVHFTDVFEPILWKWMLVYGTVIVALGQFLWFNGLKNTSPSNITLASSFSPILGVGFAVVLLGEKPDSAFLTGGAVILFGITVGAFGKFIQKNTIEESQQSEAEFIAEEGHVAFKGT